MRLEPAAALDPHARPPLTMTSVTGGRRAAARAGRGRRYAADTLPDDGLERAGASSGAGAASRRRGARRRPSTGLGPSSRPWTGLDRRRSCRTPQRRRATAAGGWRAAGVDGAGDGRIDVDLGAHRDADDVLDVPRPGPARLAHQHDARGPQRRGERAAQREVAGAEHEQRDRAAAATATARADGSDAAVGDDGPRVAEQGRASTRRAGARLAAPRGNSEARRGPDSRPGEGVGRHPRSGAEPVGQAGSVGLGGRAPREVAGEVDEEGAGRARAQGARAAATTVVPLPPLADQQEMSTEPPPEATKKKRGGGKKKKGKAKGSSHKARTLSGQPGLVDQVLGGTGQSNAGNSSQGVFPGRPQKAWSRTE